MSTVHLDINQGADYEYVHPLLDSDGEPLVTTGYTAAAQFRKWYTSSTAVDFTVAVATGELTLSLSSTVTANVTPGRYVYDAFIYDSGDVATKVMEGIITIHPSVTR